MVILAEVRQHLQSPGMTLPQYVERFSLPGGPILPSLGRLHLHTIVLAGRKSALAWD